MQNLDQIKSRHRVNSKSLNKITTSVRSNKAKINISQDIGNCGQITSDCDINFDFKYVTEAELQAIVKRVRRTRQKKLDEEKWQDFLRWKQLEVATVTSDDGVCPHCVVEEDSHTLIEYGLSKPQDHYKYVTEAELQAIVKRVRRTRQKKLDEEKWQDFLRWKQLEVATVTSDDGVCPHCVVEEDSHTLIEYGLSKPQDHYKDMPRAEEDEDKGSRITSTLGANIADNIGHAYQLGGVLTKRLQDLVATVGRMTSLLLSSDTTRSVKYEDEDVDRAIKRSVEFDAMFARNHLYEIQRLLKDAKQLAAGKSPRGELETKISAALKCIMQAIQVYAKHVNKGARVKYQQVVPIFQSISTILSLLEQLTGEHVFPFRQELEVSSSYMKQLLLEMSTTDTQSVTTVTRKPARPKPATRHKPSADLSMYSRRRADWRRKTASLARAKFGPPSGKKLKQKSDCISDNRIVENNKIDVNENDSQHHNFKITDKGHGPVKEPVNAKEVPYRNATRAVPEDNVTTMMEMIPNEPTEDEGLRLDDSTFQALKRLNGTHPPLQQEHIFENQLRNSSSIENLDLVGKTDTNSLKPSSSKSTFAFSLKSETKSPSGSKPASARSVKGEPNNVQLICLREEENPKPPSDTDSLVVDNSEISEDCRIILTIDERTKKEALEYHQNMIEYHKVNSHYKDGKALGILDRLATRILTEMVMDFQKEEMNNVIQTLYNLEFQ